MPRLPVLALALFIGACVAPVSQQQIAAADYGPAPRNADEAIVRALDELLGPNVEYSIEGTGKGWFRVPTADPCFGWRYDVQSFAAPGSGQHDMDWVVLLEGERVTHVFGKRKKIDFASGAQHYWPWRQYR